jgi:cephalosporin hydroxylase
MYYNSPERTWQNTRWLGVPIAKCPLDLWIFQEILTELRPQLIIECGTFAGGSALFFATLCDLLGQGRIVTIDIETYPNRPNHPRIEYIRGSSTSPQVFATVSQRAEGIWPVLVNLDSDHCASHVLQEMNLYGSLVSRGSYLIVEDSNINGHPVSPQFGPGPMEAIQEFLKTHTEFVPDRSREKFTCVQCDRSVVFL